MATIGFEEKFALRALIRVGLEPKDAIIILTGPLVEKTVKAIDTLRKFLDYIPSIELDIHEVEDVHYFVSAVYTIKRLLAKLANEYDKVYLILSGGMRALILEVFTAYLLLPRELTRKVSVELDTEDLKGTISIPQGLPTLLLPVYLGAKYEVLKVVVKNNGATIDELVKTTGRDSSTIRKYLNFLEGLGLITVKRRPLRAMPTDLARLMV